MTLMDFLSWSGEHAGTVAFLSLFVGASGLLAVGVYRVALAVAMLRAWWRGGSWLGAAGRHQQGGAGGHTNGYSAEYRRVLQSAGWRHRRGQVLRRQGGRCAVPGCTQRAVDVHHAEGYARLGRESLEELLGVCERHHRQLHGR